MSLIKRGSLITSPLFGKRCTKTSTKGRASQQLLWTSAGGSQQSPSNILMLSVQSLWSQHFSETKALHMPYPILLFQDQYVLIDSRSWAGYCSNNHYPMVVYPTWIRLPSVSLSQLGWQKSAIWVIIGNFSVPELPSRQKGLFSPDG